MGRPCDKDRGYPVSLRETARVGDRAVGRSRGRRLALGQGLCAGIRDEDGVEGWTARLQLPRG
jgi:hypothetical protein